MNIIKMLSKNTLKGLKPLYYTRNTNSLYYTSQLYFSSNQNPKGIPDDHDSHNGHSHDHKITSENSDVKNTLNDPNIS